MTFFEPSEQYELRWESGRVGAEFRCLGVGRQPDTGLPVAVGYWRMLRVNGRVDRWELRDLSQTTWDLSPWIKTERIMV